MTQYACRVERGKFRKPFCLTPRKDIRSIAKKAIFEIFNAVLKLSRKTGFEDICR